MRTQLQETDRLDPFDHAFVEAVLLLRGIDGIPTSHELSEALATLNSFFSALMKTPVSRELDDFEHLDADSLDTAATMYAFLYTQFGLVYWAHASAEHLAAFAHWQCTGELPRGLPLPRGNA